MKNTWLIFVFLWAPPLLADGFWENCKTWFERLYTEEQSTNPYTSPAEQGGEEFSISKYRNLLNQLSHKPRDRPLKIKGNIASGMTAFGLTTIEGSNDALVIRVQAMAGVLSLRSMASRLKLDTLPGVTFGESGKYSALRDNQGEIPQTFVVTIKRTDNDTAASFEKRVHAILGQLAEEVRS